MSEAVLGTMTKTASTPSGTAFRRLRWRMRDAAGMLTGGRVDQCGKWPVPDRFVAVRQRSDGGAYFANTRKCGSVHECPVCAARVAKVRADEIRQGLLNGLDAGLFAQAVVPTIRHEKHDQLADLLDTLKVAWRKMFAGREGQKLRGELGIVGQIRADEVTWGDSGWHPHMHVLLITTRKLDEHDGWKLFTRFEEQVIAAGGFTSWNAWKGGFHNIEDAGGISDYLTKLEKLSDRDSWSAGEELAFAVMKSGKKRPDASYWSDKERWSPWELLELFAETGDFFYGDLFAEYAAAYRGKRRLMWSPGLKKTLGVAEGLTDEEAAQDAEVEEDVELVTVLEPGQWKLVVKFDARLTVLEAAEADGRLGVDACLAWLLQVYQQGFWEPPPGQLADRLSGAAAVPN